MVLNRFDCYIIEDGQGGHQLKFVLKEGVSEAIGISHAADFSEQTLVVEDLSIDNSYTRDEPLWRDRNRGLSF